MTNDSDVGAAIGRLVDVARSDTGQSARCANFLLAWWSGDDWGHFPVADLFALDRPLAADVALIVSYLAEHPGAIYADAWGYREAMGDLVERWRPEPARPALTIGDLELNVRLANTLGQSAPARLVSEILDDPAHPLRAKLRARDLKELGEVRPVVG